MEHGSIRSVNVRQPNQAQIEEAQRNLIALGLCAYLAVRGAAFAFEKLGAGARFIQRGMESAAKAMADNAARTQSKPSQA